MDITPTALDAKDSTRVYLVVLDRGGLFGAYVDQGVADRAARAAGALVAAVPVIADYRTPDGDGD